MTDRNSNVVDHDESTQEDLEGKSFSSAAPDVSARGRVRILAIVGASDKADMAAPNNDGWFLSDFYYLHHLLKESAEPQHQAWLTCIRPKDLVTKYGEFAHGDPMSDDRRVVLDQDELPFVQDIRVVPPKELRDSFLQLLKQWSRECVEQDQQLLVIILGHGEESQTGTRIIIGAPPSEDADFEQPEILGRYQPTKVNRLDLSQVSKCIEPTARVTLVGVACFFGGWIISPHLPNISVLSAVNDKEIMSWSEATAGRCCGSRYTTAISEALIQLELPGVGLGQPTGPGPETGFIDDESPSYAAFTKAVYDTLRKKDIRENINAMHTAQDDHWGQEWRSLSGFRSHDLEERHEMLRAIPRTKASPTGESKQGSFRIDATDLEIEARAAKNITLARAFRYLGCNPGRSDLGGNQAANSGSKSIICGRPLSDAAVQALGRMLRYRLYGIMKQASDYKNHLGAEFPDCENIDPWEWVNDHAGTPAWKNHTHKIHSYARQIVREAELFDEPGQGDGPKYNKGNLYLAVLLTFKFGGSQQEMDVAIEKLKSYRAWNTPSYRTARELQLHKQPTIRDCLEGLAEEAGRQLRAMSPVKKISKSLGYGDKPIPAYKPKK